VGAISHLDDWWSSVGGSAMMGPNTFININDGQRRRLGSFVEWERHWNREWTRLLGPRNDVVWMNAGNVQEYSAMMYGADERHSMRSITPGRNGRRRSAGCMLEPFVVDQNSAIVRRDVCVS
jgi:hypothetical protein